MRLLIKSVSFFLLNAILFSGCSKKESEPFQDLLGPDSVTETQNMDAELLREMLLKIDDGEFGEIHSVLVVRNGDIVVEEYFRGWTSTDLHPLYSVTKSVTSILVGIAIDRGYLSGVDQQIMPLFLNEYASFENYDSLKASITLQNILTMAHGLQWDWEDELNFGPRADGIKYTLDLPMIDMPGTRFNYSSATTMLLSIMIQNTTGKITEQFASEMLFQPINIQRWSWGSFSRVGFQNYSSTAGGLSLRARDLANIGILMLEKGKRGDTQVISQAWVEESTRTQIIAGQTTEYGYKWWRLSDASSVVQDLRVNDMFFGWGAAGQFLFVIPHLNMVVVSNAENFENTGSQFFTILRDYIFASVRDK